MNLRLDKWSKTSDCMEEVPVAAWTPLPKFDYDLINNESKHDCESSQIQSAHVLWFRIFLLILK